VATPEAGLAGRLLLALLLAGCAPSSRPEPAAAGAGVGTGSVIFLHPDGASPAHWLALRNLDVGPDGHLEWDRLPAMALYRGHLRDSLTATSQGGATAHAYGIKPSHDAFGTTGGAIPERIADAQGRSLSVAHQAMRRGLRVGLVQSGTVVEPGTAAFVASVEDRAMHDEIAAQLVASGVDLVLGGGEEHFLPEGVEGVHGPGNRRDARNLVVEAETAGYTVVYTREQLRSLPDGVGRVLGLFAAHHTFHDATEEDLRARGLPLYEPDAPTLAEMSEAALRILSAAGERFLLVIEEEGVDNFGNKNNARGTIEAARRADEAIGLCRAWVEDRGDALLLTAADSDSGGLQVIGYPLGSVPERVAATHDNGAPLDGVDGTGTAPFLAAPDRAGKQLWFAIAWASNEDVSGGILVRGVGLNSDRIRGSFDNTDVAAVIRLTLFGIDGP
jgi:alkaline phosphatase